MTLQDRVDGYIEARGPELEAMTSAKLEACLVEAESVIKDLEAHPGQIGLTLELAMAERRTIRYILRQRQKPSPVVTEPLPCPFDR